MSVNVFYKRNSLHLPWEGGWWCVGKWVWKQRGLRRVQSFRCLYLNFWLSLWCCRLMHRCLVVVVSTLISQMISKGSFPTLTYSWNGWGDPALSRGLDWGCPMWLEASGGERSRRRGKVWGTACSQSMLLSSAEHWSQSLHSKFLSWAAIAARLVMAVPTPFQKKKPHKLQKIDP